MGATDVTSADPRQPFEALQLDSERLTELARQMVVMAAESTNFRDHPGYKMATAEFRTVLANMNSIAVTF